MAKRSKLQIGPDSSRWLQIAPHEKLHFPDGVEQELAEITESAEEKSLAAERRGKTRKGAERSGFSNGMGGVTGAMSAAK